MATSSRCVGCRTMICGTDLLLCKLFQAVNSTGGALEAFEDGAIAGAFLAGVDLDTYEARLRAAYERAKTELAEYRGASVPCSECGRCPRCLGDAQGACHPAGTSHRACP